MKRMLILSLIIILAIISVGCSEESVETIGIRGKIKELYIVEDELTITGFLVEGEVQDDTMYDSANVSIGEDTEIYRNEKKINSEELEEGLIVEIIFDGPVAESYPVQGTAKKIIIIDED